MERFRNTFLGCRKETNNKTVQPLRGEGCLGLPWLRAGERGLWGV